MRTERTPYSTTLYIWDRASAMFYSSYVTPFHSHNTMQLIFDLGGRFRLRTRDTEWQSYECLIIRENVVHRLDTGGSAQLIIYLDAASDVASAIRTRYLQQRDLYVPSVELRRLVRPGELEKCLIGPDKSLLEKVTDRILLELLCAPPPREDERIKKVRELIAGDCSAEVGLTICRLAGSLYISESRLRTLFKKSAGISLHKYIVLHRVTVAITEIMNGAAILEAAIKAGFADSSHLHKVLLTHFGTSPSRFLRDNSSKKIERSPGSPFRLVTHQYDERSWTVVSSMQI